MSVGSLVALPGVVVHELGHYVFCRLVGTKVQEVVFFDAKGPSGYVVHAVPRRLRHHVAIVAGPLLLNSVLGFLLFRAAAVSLLGLSSATPPWPLLQIGQAALAVLLGASISLQAIPSRADASSLWNVALDRLEQGNLLAVLVLPPAAGLLLANRLRRFWIDWLYLCLLVGVAGLLPVH